MSKSEKEKGNQEKPDNRTPLTADQMRQAYEKINEEARRKIAEQNEAKKKDTKR